MRLRPSGSFCFPEANARPSVEDGTALRFASQLAGLDGPQLLASILANAAWRHQRQDLLDRLAPISQPAEERLWESFMT